MPGWMRRAGGLGRLALCLALLACGGERERPRSVLLVSIDTLRADRLGCYGREAAGTPHHDALARRGVRFADANAPSPVTLPSHATLLSGWDPLRHGIRHNGRFALADEVETLAERLRQAGLRTGAFVGSVVLAERYGLAQGFERYTAPSSGAPGVFFLGQRPAPEVNRDALAWLDSIGPDPFFLFVHYMEPHAPYAPPEPERSRFPDDPYQGEVAAADRALGELLAGLAERGRLAETAVHLVGDHGESLGEHGEVSHGLFLYQSTLRVPWIAAGPGVAPGAVRSEAVTLADLTPTLLDSLGLPLEGILDGRSRWEALGGGAAAPERALYAETWLPFYNHGWSELSALRRGRWKVLRAPRPELYDLERDPGETRNLAALEPERLREMEAALEAHRTAFAHGAPAPEAAPSDEERAALGALGYLPGLPSAGQASRDADPRQLLAEIADLERASGWVQAGRHAEAAALLRQMVERNPLYTEARLRLMTALLLGGREDEAAAEARALVERSRELPDGERLAALAHLFLAEHALRAGRLEEAAREFERSLATPQPSGVHEALAAVYAQLGRREDALRILRIPEARGDAGTLSQELRRWLDDEAPPRSGR